MTCRAPVVVLAAALLANACDETGPLDVALPAVVFVSVDAPRDKGECDSVGATQDQTVAACKDAGIIALHQLPYSLFWRAIEFAKAGGAETGG